MSSPAPDRIPDLYVEQYLLGELPEAQRARVEQWLATPAGEQRLADLRAADARFAENLGGFAAAVARKQRLASAETSARTWRVWGLAAATACALLLGWWLVATLPGEDTELDAPVAESDLPDGAIARRMPEPEPTRIKGLSPYLVVHRRLPTGETLALGDGERAHDRDLLQLSYVAAARPFGVILSVDGRGAVTLHFPESGSAQTRLEPGSETALPHAYELDDAPRFERFFFVTSAEPIEVERVLFAARELSRRTDAQSAPLRLDSGLEQTSVTLLKEP